jgi:hypothetical protein
MPTNNIHSAFIWYHAQADNKQDLQQWISFIESTLHVQGKLYQRIQNEKTTFMEVFECVDYAMIEKIEHLATQQDCFLGIERRCESFQRIDNT